MNMEKAQLLLDKAGPMPSKTKCLLIESPDGRFERYHRRIRINFYDASCKLANSQKPVELVYRALMSYFILYKEPADLNVSWCVEIPYPYGENTLFGRKPGS